MKRLGQLIIILFLWLPMLVSAGDAKFALTWDAPIANIDGTPLTDLQGFRLYWSQTSGIYNSVDSKNITQANTEVVLTENIMWYFVVTAYDDLGNESIYSNEVNLRKAISPSGCKNLNVE